MKRHSSRYVDTDQSVSLSETANWVQQSNFYNCSQHSADFQNSPIDPGEDVRETQAVTTQSTSFPSSKLVPFLEQSTEHGFAGQYLDADEEERRVLLAITVEVEDGHLEYIEIRDGDSAEAAATNFCQAHLLPEKYVAPLTEHIVQEVRRISKVDKSIRFASQDGMVYTDEAGTEQASEEKNLESAEHNWSSKNNQDYRYDTEQRQSPNASNRAHNSEKLSKTLSESLLSPTFTSLAKSQANNQSEKQENRRSKQISERAKAVYMRLYGEFLRQKQRIEEQKRWCQEQYQQRIERDKPAISKKTRRIMRLRGRAAKQFRNYGELLYREGLNKEEERQRIIQKKLQEDEDRELRFLTLRPEISKLAKQIKRDDGPVWDRLLHEKPRHDLQGLRQEVWEAKFMECTFRPRINQQSADDDYLSHNRFDQLFWDAENRRRRQAEYGQWYPEGVTFRPVINRYNKSLGNLDEQGRYHEGNVFNRLMQYAEKLAEKKRRIQEIQDKSIKHMDLSTGQELFRPQTGRKPLAERNTASLPIGDFLYQQKFELENKKKSMAAKDWKERKELANGHYVGQRSQQLLNRLRDRKLLKLFEHLDKDRDGFVDLDSSELKKLPQEVVSDISEIQHLGTVNKKHVTFPEFLQLMSHLQKKGNSISYLDQKCTKKNHQGSEKFTFQFKMDRYSRSLANRKRRFSSRHQWYKMILMDRAKWQAKVESLRKEKQKQELAECTFRPVIHSTSSRSHLRLTDGVVNHANTKAETQNATIVEKELQEVHGFIFQEAAMQKSDLTGKPNGESPLGLLQSFKNMVRNSEQGDGEP